MINISARLKEALKEKYLSRVLSVCKRGNIREQGLTFFGEEATWSIVQNECLGIKLAKEKKNNAKEEGKDEASKVCRR